MMHGCNVMFKLHTPSNVYVGLVFQQEEEDNVMRIRVNENKTARRKQTSEDTHNMKIIAL